MSVVSHQPIQGAGLGLRRSMASRLSEATPEGIDFLEVAPENWIGLGGRFAKQLRAISERTPLITHGLSLSIGGPAPLDEDLDGSAHQLVEALLRNASHRAESVPPTGSNCWKLMNGRKSQACVRS